MNLFKELSTLTKLFLGAGFVLVIYGYLARAINLYFFWESKFIGWIIVSIGLISLLSNLIRYKKQLNKKTIFEKIGIGLIAFMILIQIFFLIVLPNTDAYAAAKKILRANEEIKTELGDIKSFAIIPLGAISVSSGEDGSTGTATLTIIAKGDKKFKDFTVFMEKEINTDWSIYEIR